MRYNVQYKVRFNYSPIMQCILGQFEGWRIVIDLYNNSRPIEKGDEVLFVYNKNSFNKLVKYVNKVNSEV